MGLDTLRYFYLENVSGVPLTGEFLSRIFWMVLRVPECRDLDEMRVLFLKLIDRPGRNEMLPAKEPLAFELNIALFCKVPAGEVENASLSLWGLYRLFTAA